MHTSFFHQCMRKKISSSIFLPHFPSFQTLFHFRPFSSHKITHAAKSKKLDKALRVLDLIAPKTAVSVNRQSHLRLIQDFLKTESYEFSKQQFDNDDAVINNVFDEMLKHGVLNTDDALKKVDLRTNASVLSHAVSSCASLRTLHYGVQLHGLAIATGFMVNVYVGSSLINLYSKCNELENASKLFEEMPVRNVVSWTVIIAGFAQEWQVDACLDLYRRMRNSNSRPNDFTFTSLLSACTGSGALGQGRCAHCQTIQMGFDSYLHIANVLISMYSKCGKLEDAFQIFESIQSRDIISWNSIIAGCSLHGLAWQALDLFKKMKEQRLDPDAITFLGVLSSCRHGGLVQQGRLCFNSMLEHGVKPELDHYSCIVDLLGRAGLLEEAREFIQKMPIYPNAVIWGSLLSSCRLHGNVWHGIQAAESRLLLEPGCAATHVQLANLYASARCWDQAARLRKLMKDRGLKTIPGYSWIEIKNELYQFRADDKSNSRLTEILSVVDTLVDHMRSLGYVPEIDEQEIDDGIYVVVPG